MKRLNDSGGKCFFLGSSNETLQRISERAIIDYPNVQVSHYSPPFKAEFSEDDSYAMVEHVNPKNSS